MHQPTSPMDDPRKLSTQELVQLCLDSQDEASWTEFVRRFQLLIRDVVAKGVYCNRQICSRDDSFVHPLPFLPANLPGFESKLHNSLTFGINTLWPH